MTLPRKWDIRIPVIFTGSLSSATGISDFPSGDEKILEKQKRSAAGRFRAALQL